MSMAAMIGDDGRRQNLGLGARRFLLLGGGEALLRQIGEALQIGLRIGEVGLVAHQCCLRLFHLRLEQGGIQAEQQIALMHHLAFAEGRFHDAAIDLGFDLDRGIDADGADGMGADFEGSADDGATITGAARGRPRDRFRRRLRACAFE